uniref:Putative secreted protein n=1 Tax=Anopheles triannulatus TaxID=58253 RepID=A0A2M4B2D7_9DIPT
MRLSIGISIAMVIRSSFPLVKSCSTIIHLYCCAYPPLFSQASVGQGNLSGIMKRPSAPILTVGVCVRA